MKRLPSPIYEARKEALQNEQFRLELELAEEHILAGPSLPPDRIEIEGIVYDKTQPGVLLMYEVTGDGVRFLAFCDIFLA